VPQTGHLLYALAALLVLAGLVGIVAPILPGGILLFAGIVVLAWADGFARIGWLPLTVCGVLLVLMGVADWTAAALGAKRVGGSRWGVVGAFVGMLAGLPFGLPGVLLGPFAGAALFEYLRDRDFQRAVKVGGGTTVGFLLGTAVKYALAAAMLGVALIAWAWG
jgi:uncharacterized protein YqgC (DUF456 family)